MDKKERMRNSYSELPEGEDASPAKVPTATKKESWKNKEGREIRILKKSKSIKEKNDPDRFSGEGINFRAKIIGIEDVFDARGNRMCQGALQKLKAAVKTSGDHKQKIILNISLNGILIKEEKSGEVLHHHPIHKISFISQDTKDNRAFGYVYGCPQTGHRFFAIKTEKAASQVVVTLRDLFLVALEIKKKEIEKSIDPPKESTEEEKETGEEIENGISSASPLFSEKGSGDQGLNHSLLYSNTVLLPDEIFPEKSESEAEVAHESPPDLQSEVNILQQGISQIDQSIANAVSQTLGISLSEDEVSESSTSSYQTAFQLKLDKLSSLYHETLSISSRSSSTSDYFIGVAENKPEDTDTPKKNTVPGVSARCSSGSLSGEGNSSISETHHTNSTADSSTEDRYAVFLDIDSLPSIFDNPNIGKLPDEKVTEVIVTNQNGCVSNRVNESDVKPSTLIVFSELDPLGSQPYVDKKDFFQGLKKPPKKVLKDLAGGSESGAFSNPNECLASSDLKFDNQECTFSNGVTYTPKLPPKRETASELFQDNGFVDNPVSWEFKNPFNPFLLEDYPDVPPPNSPPPPPPPRLPTKALDSSPPRPPSRVNGVPTPPLPKRKVPLSSSNRTWFSFDQDAGAKPSLPSPVRKLPPPNPLIKSSSASNSPATVRRLYGKNASPVISGESKSPYLCSIQSRQSSVVQESNPFSEYPDLLERHIENCSPPLPPKPTFISQSPSKKVVPYSSSSSSAIESSSISTHSSSSLVFSSPDARKMGSSSEVLFLSSTDSQSDVIQPQSSNGEKPTDISPDSIFRRKEDPFADDFFLSLHKKSNYETQAITKKSSPVLEVPFDNLKAPT